MTVVIVGAGASGLACAVRLKQRLPECEVKIFERMPTAAKKLLATGNGRCNFSNIAAPDCKEVVAFFNSIGLKERTDEEGRIYPYSSKASTVVEVLTDSCRRLGVQIITDCRVTKTGRDMSVETDRGICKADFIVVACGGAAQKNLGSDGSGYELLSSIGHKIEPISPALVQLTSPNKSLHRLKGQRAKCSVSIVTGGKTAGTQYGEVLFTDYGLSGIAVMNLSEFVSRSLQKNPQERCTAVLDLIPDMSEDELTDYVKRFGSLRGILGSDISSVIERQSGGEPHRAAQIAKHWEFIINGTKGFDFAQITSGGAGLDGFNGFESKIAENIFACGEVLDVQYPCGGFNLSFAFHSGICTANAIADKYEGRQNA